MTKKFLVYVASILFFGGLTYLGLQTYKNLFVPISSLFTPISSNSKKVIFEVQPKTSLHKISEELVQKELIPNSTYFLMYVKIRKQSDKLKVGEYELNQSMTPVQILDVLLSGKSVLHQLVIPEGSNLFDIAAAFEKQELLSQADFMKLAHDPVFIEELTGKKLNSLEGFLFPDTYSFTKYTTVKEILGQMYKKFTEAYSQISKQGLAADWPQIKIVTLASIIEKETGASHERRIISSVFHNRLRKDMMLQTDPTVIYGKALRMGLLENKISREDLLTPTPYNTYTMKGLPPGPIANPGLESLKAAVNPETTDFLFFVSHNDGTHQFSQTYEQHNKAVKKFQLDPKAREGRSWRDLKDKSP